MTSKSTVLEMLKRVSEMVEGIPAPPRVEVNGEPYFSKTEYDRVYRDGQRQGVISERSRAVQVLGTLRKQELNGSSSAHYLWREGYAAALKHLNEQLNTPGYDTPA